MIISDLQTPVNDILSWANALLREVDGTLSEEQREFIQIVQSNATRLQVLVSHLQEHSDDGTLMQSVAKMNHQINTPLTAIFGYSGLLLSSRDEPLNTAQADKLRQIYATGQYLRSIVTISVGAQQRDATTA